MVAHPHNPFQGTPGVKTQTYLRKKEKYSRHTGTVFIISVGHIIRNAYNEWGLPTMYTCISDNKHKSKRKVSLLTIPTYIIICDALQQKREQIASKRGHWTSLTSSPTFSKKSWDFYTIWSVGMGNDCMQSFTFHIDLLLKKYEYF